jgi:hypothetical protein
MERLALLSVCLIGCSFAFVRGPGGGGREATCTESRIAPVTDVVLAAGLGAAGVGMARTPECVACGINAGAVGSALIVTGLVYAVSALHGFTASASCRQAHRE